MLRRNVIVVMVVSLLFVGLAQAKEAKSGVLDKAYIQTIWNGWASGNVEGQTKYYAQGAGHLYFDIAPLKYNSWDEYKAGVAPILKTFSEMKATVNDDLQIHAAGKMAWVDGTINFSVKDAKGAPSNMVLRWTAIFEKVNGTWVIQHEHVSVPMAGM